jgi:hypothetical protein
VRSSSLSLICALDACGWSKLRPGRVTRGKETRYTFYVQDVWWTPGSVWTGEKNVAPKGFNLRTVQPVVTTLSQPTSEKVCFSKHRCMSTRPYDVTSLKSVNSLRIATKT